jgi:hypothetical protein
MLPPFPKSLFMFLLLVSSLPLVAQQHPCKWVGTQEVIDLFDLSIEPTQKTEEEPFPSCFYSWPGGLKKVTKIGSMELEAPMESGLTIVYYDKPANESHFQRAVDSYQDAEPYADLGDQAVWSDKRRQVSVLSGTHLFHVHVHFSDDNEANRKMAFRISEYLIDQLN